MGDPAAPLNPRNSPAVEAAFAACSAEVVAEILDGELHVQPRPARPHTVATSELAFELGPPFRRGRGGPGGWVILLEPELHLGPGPDKLAPDMAGWRRERMPDALGDADAPSFYDLPPDWVCEVISPSTERIDRSKKSRIYRREGVRHLWFLNPIAKTLEVYRLEAERWVLLDVFEGDAVVRAEPFDAIELELANLWSR